MHTQYKNEIIEDSYEAHGEKHWFKAQLYLYLSVEERKAHGVKDGQFLVELRSGDGDVRLFKVFYDDDNFLQWTTDAPASVIDRESIEVIGSIIEEHHF